MELASTVYVLKAGSDTSGASQKFFSETQYNDLVIAFCNKVMELNQDPDVHAAHVSTTCIPALTEFERTMLSWTKMGPEYKHFEGHDTIDSFKIR